MSHGCNCIHQVRGHVELEGSGHFGKLLTYSITNMFSPKYLEFSSFDDMNVIIHPFMKDIWFWKPIYLAKESDHIMNFLLEIGAPQCLGPPREKRPWLFKPKNIYGPFKFLLICVIILLCIIYSKICIWLKIWTLGDFIKEIFVQFYHNITIYIFNTFVLYIKMHCHS